MIRAAALAPGLLGAVTLAALLPSSGAGISPPRPSQVTGGFLVPHHTRERGPSYVAILALRARSVRVRSGGITVAARLNRHASSIFRRGKVWELGRLQRDRSPEMRRFVRSVMAEYRREGRVSLRVRSANQGGVVVWHCKLTERTRQSSCAGPPR